MEVAVAVAVEVEVAVAVALVWPGMLPGMPALIGMPVTGGSGSGFDTLAAQARPARPAHSARPAPRHRPWCLPRAPMRLPALAAPHE